MLRTFIYQNNIWVEETDQLLLHDCVAFLDEEERRVYLYNGPKSTYKRLEKGYDSVTKLMLNLPDDSIQLTVLLDEMPEKIQKRIDSMFESVRKEEETNKRRFSTLVTIRLYLIFSILTLVLPAFSILNMMNFLNCPVSSGVATVAAGNYNSWLLISRVLMVITIIFFIFNIIIGAYEQNIMVVVLALSGAIICIGINLYLEQGMFLFRFQPGSISTVYLILQLDLVVFFTLNLVAVLIFEIPILLNLILFVRTYREYIFLR